MDVAVSYVDYMAIAVGYSGYRVLHIFGTWLQIAIKEGDNYSATPTT
jgi:hypothetical protein